MSNQIDFREAFESLTANKPFPWQEAMYSTMAAGEFEKLASCCLPTGLGKSSVIPIWLIALANAPKLVPRRLVYIVNRRTVVDQATDESERIRDRLLDDGRPDIIRKLFDRLKRLSCDSSAASPFAISTLRGQFADNTDWRSDPARPALICGTIDMIGSRLLFSGYGCGFKTRPLHAGFLGQDSLIVHDEAHLEPAFHELLCAIRAEQERCGDFRPLKVLELTATSRAGSECFGLTARDLKHPEIKKRLNAAKAVRFHEIAGEKKLAETVAQFALKYRDSGRAVLLFCRTVADVQKVAGKLGNSVLQLTGTLRGLERDRLTESPIFRRFLGRADGQEGTVYLVCTSAGEVGVNISGDHLVCDLTTFESMAQRFGRVNRFGEGKARIDVIYPREFEDNNVRPAREKTLELLKRLPIVPSVASPEDILYDASPKALNELKSLPDLPCSIFDAYSPEPAMLDVTEIQFNAWALTSIRKPMPGRPAIAPFLHGIAEWEPPETYVAWREEVDIIRGDLLDRYRPEDLLDDYPLKPSELLHDSSTRVFDALQNLAVRNPHGPVWVIDQLGNVATSELRSLANPSATQAGAKKPLIAAIGECTILLPPSAGGLNPGGMLDGASPRANDVADIDEPAAGQRIRIWSDDDSLLEETRDMRLVQSIDVGGVDGDERVTWDWYVRKSQEGARIWRLPVLLDVHVSDVRGVAEQILRGLTLAPDLASAIRVAARLHDEGKRRPPFQLMLGNYSYPRVAHAKSGRAGAKLPEPYRHEFGSLSDAKKDRELQELSSDMQDVVLHLIAAHHGRARPCFPPAEVFDPEFPQSESDMLAYEVAHRFARLQRKYGRWGLAYIESLLRAADWAASSDPSQFVTGRE